uniref:G protein-coupled receptor n=1 Tax=Pristionchus pacificus TaxID=54126 RepID=A0A8R1YUQ0_PRIPA
MSTFITVVNSIEGINTFLGLFLNVLLLYAIRKFSRAHLGAYKHLLTIFTLVDLFLRVLRAGNTHGTVTDTVFDDQNVIMNQRVTALYIGCQSVPFTLLGIHFLYRYWSVRSPHLIQLFSRKPFVIFMASLTNGVLISWYFLSMFSGSGHDISAARMEVATEYESKYGKRIENAWILFDHWATVPSLFVYVPYLACIDLPFLRIPGTIFHDACASCFTFFPVWDAAIIILLFADYRSGLAGIVWKKKQTSTAHTTLHVTSTVQMLSSLSLSSSTVFSFERSPKATTAWVIIDIFYSLMLLKIFYTQSCIISIILFRLKSFQIMIYNIAESHTNSFLVSGRGVLDSSFAASLFMGVFGTSSPLITGNFCYRLLLLKGFAFGRYASAQDENTDRVLGSLLNGSVPSPMIHTPNNAESYIIAMFWNGETFEGPRWKVIGTVFGLSVMLSGNYCVMVYCTLRIMRLLEGQGSFNSKLSMCIFFGVFGSSSPLVMGSFCYRLMQLKKQIRFDAFYVWMIAYTSFTAFVWFAVGRYACVLDDDVWSAIGPFLNGTVHSPVIHSDETADRYIMALYWTRHTFDGVRLPSILGMCALNVLLTLNYVVMTYCTVQMKRQLNIHNLMSAATLRMHRQLLRSLLGQMIFPLVTIYAACMVAMVFTPLWYPSPIQIYAVSIHSQTE